jgi:hypothetical protein
MTAMPGEVFARYVAELERRQVRYVMLHSYESFPDRFPSDIDYAVPDAELPTIRSIQTEVAEQCGWTLALTVQHQSCAFHTVLINPNNPTEYLQLDACSHYLSHGCRLVRDQDLIEGRRKWKDFYIPAASSEFVYRLARMLIKRKDMAEQLPRLQALWQEDSKRSAQLWVSLFGNDVGSFEDWSKRPPEAWGQLRSRMISRNRFTLPYRLKEYRRLLHRVTHPIGIRMALLGPDGAGKSTLLPNIETLLRPCTRGQKVVHFCPMMFRKLPNTVVTEPHAQQPRSIVVSWIKVCYHFIDHWMGFLLQQAPDKWRGVCTIFDRDFIDLFIDPIRYRIQHAGPFVKLLNSVLPPMDLTIVLDASPDLIHRRKPELTIQELERQRSVLKELAGNDASFTMVSAEQPPETVALHAAKAVILALGAREKRWTPPHDR